MPDNRIGIQIEAEAHGGEGLRQQIGDYKALYNISSQFEDLRRDASEKYPRELEKQNRYIREQLGLLKQMETAGSRGRVADLKERMDKSISTREKGELERKIQYEQREHIRAGIGISEADIGRRMWAEKMGIGIQQGQGGFGNDVVDVMLAGRGGGGYAAMAGTKMMGRGRAMLGGMSGGAKVAAGAGIGLLAFIGYKAAQHLKKGYDSVLENSPEMANLMTLTQNIPQGNKAERSFEMGIHRMNVEMAETISKTIQLQKEWMRLGGTFKTAGGSLSEAVLVGKSFGLSPDETISYLGVRGHTGYLPDMPQDKKESYTVMANMIQKANLGGMSKGRIFDFLQMYESVIPQILSTSVTANSDSILSLVSSFSQMGEPFRGQRGAQVMGGLQGTMTGGGGFMTEAARRILVGRGEKATPWALQKQIQEGLNDPANLREVWGVAMDMAGGDIERASYLTSSMFNQPMKMWYNDTKNKEGINPRDSLSELIMGKGTGVGAGGEMSADELRKQYDSYKETYGFGAAQYKAAVESSEYIAASKLFGTATDKFHEAVTNFVEKGILIKVDRSPLGFNFLGKPSVDKQEFTPSEKRREGEVSSYRMNM